MSDATISIITVTYNCENLLKKTIQSVKKMIPVKYWSLIEYIIIDGKSDDETVDIAKKELIQFEEKGMRTRLISEEDTGIYNAMNKGLSFAIGKWIYMLNAGDVFNNEFSFSELYAVLSSTDADLVYGKTMRIHPEFSELWEPAPLENIKKGMIFCHQSVFIKREIKEHFYDEKYRCCADYDLMLRLYLAGYKFHYYAKVIINYEMSGITATTSIKTACKETYDIKKYYKFIENSVLDKIRYSIELFKCDLIVLLPEKLRWNMTKLLRKIKSKNHF